MMVMTQVSWASGGTLAPAAPTIATLTFGLHAIAAFLDFKARSTPEEITAPEYYGIAADDKEQEEDTIVVLKEETPAQPNDASEEV
jgi:hypothetical protein